MVFKVGELSRELKKNPICSQGFHPEDRSRKQPVTTEHLYVVRAEDRRPVKLRNATVDVLAAQQKGKLENTPFPLENLGTARAEELDRSVCQSALYFGNREQMHTRKVRFQSCGGFPQQIEQGLLLNGLRVGLDKPTGVKRLRPSTHENVCVHLESAKQSLVVLVN